MLHFDYTWDLGRGYIIPDQELNTKALGWEQGQFWQVEEQNGRLMLKQVDPLVQFTLIGKEQRDE